MSEEAQVHADRLHYMQEAWRALLVARELGLSDRDCLVIAYQCGFGSDFYKEIQKWP